jgi:hypothetical protein
MSMKPLALSAMALLVAACVESKPPATDRFKTNLGMKELMQFVIDPPADVFWGASGTIITAQGEEDRSPTSDAGWDAAVSAAATLAEAANLLMLPGRGLEEREWLAYSQQLADVSIAAMKAAQARDKEAVFATGEQVYFACRACHKKYLFGQ